MREHERESARDDAFEALLAQSVDELPPEEIVADVTPWRRAMERVLFGLALCMVTLNFWCLNYILPAIGTVLLCSAFVRCGGKTRGSAAALCAPCCARRACSRR